MNNKEVAGKLLKIAEDVIADEGVDKKFKISGRYMHIQLSSENPVGEVEYSMNRVKKLAEMAKSDMKRIGARKVRKMGYGFGKSSCVNYFFSDFRGAESALENIGYARGEF